jgi:16S rRNA (guanine527-N7)-methyltransferase
MTHAELLAAGFEVDAGAHARLARYVELLLEHNRRVNLTAIRAVEEAWRVHICDSLALLPLVRAAGPRKLLDLGTGGGLPGVPVACVCADVQVTLVDATRKKLAAVERMVADLGLANVRCVWGRAERLAHEPALREQFDAVMARAFAELRVLVECAAGFVRRAGWCWFFKTAGAAAEEVAAAEPAATRCALEFVENRAYRLPADVAERVIVVYRKMGVLAADLPRGPGRPAKRPL